MKKYTERRADAVKELEILIKTAKTRELTQDEKNLFEDVETSIAQIDEILKINKEKTFNHLKSDNNMSNSNTWGDAEEGKPIFNFYIKKTVPTNKAMPISTWVLKNYDINEDAQMARVEDVIVALCTGKIKNKATEAAMVSMKSVSGSATLTEFLSAQLWESGIAKSHLANSGMQTFLMDEPTVRFPKITAYPALEWKAENAQTTDRTVTIAGVERQAKTLRGFTVISGELMQDGHNVGNAINRAFSVSVGNSVDEAGLAGAGGADEPEGIINYSNVSTYSLGQASITSFDPWIDTIKEILDNNGSVPDTSIMSPQTWAQVQKLKSDVELMPLPRPEVLKDHRFLESTKMPNNFVVMGNFASLHLGIRLNTQIVISPVLSDTFQHNILGVFRGEFFPEREADFGLLESQAT
jgi:HK97 family phage major capsid protein